jgi:hypothetical protein
VHEHHSRFPAFLGKSRERLHGHNVTQRNSNFKTESKVVLCTKRFNRQSQITHPFALLQVCLRGKSPARDHCQT